MFKELVVLCCVAVACGDDASERKDGAHPKVVKVTDEAIIIGRCGIAIGVPFRAEIQLKRGRIVVLGVNGQDLTPARTFVEYDSRDELQRVMWAWEEVDMVDESKTKKVDTQQLTAKTRLCLRGIRTGDPPTIPTPANNEKISVEAIGEGVRFVGTFGRPLGEWMDIEGRWQFDKDKADKYSWRFLVTRVNGNATSGQEFLLVDVIPFIVGPEVSPVEGQVWQLRAFETFEYYGCSEQLLQVIGNYAANRPFRRYAGLRWRSLKVLTTNGE